MTVKELIAELQDYPEDTPVAFAYNYGDHWNTQVVDPVRDVTEADCNYSDYHSTYALDRGEPDDRTKTFVVLS